MKEKNRGEILLEQMIRDLANGVEFSNQPRQNPPKESASSNALHKTWGGKINAKPSSSTQGGWDTANTPGAVSEKAKATWTKDQMAAFVTRTLKEQFSFGNDPVVPTGKISASTQPAYKKEPDHYGRISASTQSAWKQGVEGEGYVLRYHAGTGKTPKF